MTQIHLVSHTHWDREWYQPYQVFRLRLVHLIDNLLSLLERDSEYQHFMLDGQTIVLDDYISYRPEKAESLKHFVKEGRLLIGPWHILPDEFLVSPEATVRNLLQGDRTAREYGKKMFIGYIPDPFGHIGQMPQILQGFGMDSACFQRGLFTDTTEFWWQSPDGTRVLTVYLRDGYGNASYLPVNDIERAFQQVVHLKDSLLPYSHTANVLLMYGTDHMEPREQTGHAVKQINQRLDGDHLIHSTLPAYIQSVRDELNRSGVEIPVIAGEMRSSQRSPVLPGVLSARMWIKQRNHFCENMLERWVEPFSSFAQLVASYREKPDIVAPSQMRLGHPAEIIRSTWRLLMECHPHDSICGCSIDQVHTEMAARFDQVEQTAEELTRQNLQCLADVVNTHQAGQDAMQSLVVFNATQFDQTGLVQATFQLPAYADQFTIVDQAGKEIEYTVVARQQQELARMDFNKEGLSLAVGYLQTGEYNGSVLESFNVQRQGQSCSFCLVMRDRGEPDQEVLRQGLDSVREMLTDPDLEQYNVQFVTPNQITVEMLCRDVPGLGYRTYWVRESHASSDHHVVEQSPARIESDLFTIEVDREDGSLRLTDRRSGTVYPGLNRFVDGGDRGDEYNYCPPAADIQLAPKVEAIRIESHGPVTRLRLKLMITTPLSLSADRKSRCDATVETRIESVVTLVDGLPPIDVKTTIDNRASDHRLRVHFEAPIHVDRATYDGHFDVLERPLGIPGYDSTWSEAPRAEQPQRLFTSISDGQTGLMVANQGLPEVEVLPQAAGTEIALTLLRCVGWLSRGDLENRPGHAGPGYATPGAQMIGEWTFHYSILPFNADWKDVYPMALGFDLPFRAVSTGVHSGILPAAASLIRCISDNAIVSNVKWAENGDGLVFRAYNPSNSPSRLSIKPLFNCQSVIRARIDETGIESIPVHPGGSTSVLIHPKQILTLRFPLASDGERQLY